MTKADELAAQVEAQLSDKTKAHMRRLFAERKARPSGLLLMAEQEGEDVGGLTRLAISAWLTLGSSRSVSM
jgi:hypothetical protein